VQRSGNMIPGKWKTGSKRTSRGSGKHDFEVNN
jgi:hypothetical protein